MGILGIIRWNKFFYSVNKWSLMQGEKKRHITERVLFLEHECEAGEGKLPFG